VLVPPQWKPTSTTREGRPLGSAEAAMQTYLTMPICCVLELSWFLDGDARPCGPGALLCDQCSQAGVVCVPNSITVASHAGGEATDDDLADLRAGGEELRQ
jgi:hypothetical protein